jgi:folate-dependent phosphoribosylglycinamide formyltransferase PurN
MMRLAVLAPTPSSLYSRLVTHLAAGEAGIEVVLIVVRSMLSPRRLRSEVRRDGPRLIEKIYRKLLLGERAYPPDDPDTLLGLALQSGLVARTLRELARRNRIPLLTAGDMNGRRAEQALRAARPDVIAFTGGGLIRSALLSVPRLGILNCHMGILPELRGMDVVEWAVLEAGEESPRIGLTLHLMDRGVDTGPILLHHHLDLRLGDTLEAVRQRLEPAMVRLMMQGICGLRDGSITPRTQSEAAGRQYYVMHPRLHAAASARLARILQARFPS